MTSQSSRPSSQPVGGLQTSRVLVVANPSSGGGATARRIPDLERALRHHGLAYTLRTTTHPGHATKLVEEALCESFDVVAVVGGDGTVNEALQPYGRRARAATLAGHTATTELPDVALIPSGSGGDFRKSFGFSVSVEEAVARLRFGQRRACDLGLVEARDHDGRTFDRVFVNILGFGVGGLVDQQVNRGQGKGLGGTPAYFLATLRALAEYKNVDVRIRIDGATFYEGPIVNVAIANGRFFGGGMKIAPHADPSDQRFEVVVVGDLNRLELLALTPKLYAGAHLGRHGVTVGSGTVVEAEAIHPWAHCLLDVDGEAPGKLPLRATLLPNAFSLRV